MGDIQVEYSLLYESCDVTSNNLLLLVESVGNAEEITTNAASEHQYLIDLCERCPLLGNISAHMT